MVINLNIKELINDNMMINEEDFDSEIFGLDIEMITLIDILNILNDDLLCSTLEEYNFDPNICNDINSYYYECIYDNKAFLDLICKYYNIIIEEITTCGNNLELCMITYQLTKYGKIPRDEFIDTFIYSIIEPLKEIVFKYEYNSYLEEIEY